MAEAIATRRIPGKPTTIQTVPKTRGVVSKWVEPAAWSDGSTEDFTEDAVQRYDVELWRAGAMVDSCRTKATRHFWPMTKAEAQLTGYSTKVWSVGVDGDALDADAPAGSATPEDITLGNIDGTVTKPQMGTLGISRFGSTSTMNAAAAVDGDIWINTSFSPTRVYRRVSGAWVYEIKGDVLQAGTVIADAVVAGALDAETINGVIINGGIFTGGTFQTASAGNRVLITGTAGQAAFLQFLNGSTPLGTLAANSTQMAIFGPNGVNILEFSNNLVELNALSNFKASGAMWIGEDTGTPPAGYFAFYKSSGGSDIRVKTSTGAEFSLNKTAI